MHHKILTGTGTLTIPAGVTSITATGNGSAGTAGYTTYTFVTGGAVNPGVLVYPDGAANGASASVVWKWQPDGPVMGTAVLPHQGNGYYKGTSDIWAQYAVSTSGGAAGATTTGIITGQPALQFPGGAAGQSAVQSTERRVLGAGPTVLTYNVPPGGYLKIEW